MGPIIIPSKPGSIIPYSNQELVIGVWSSAELARNRRNQCLGHPAGSKWHEIPPVMYGISPLNPTYMELYELYNVIK